MGGENSDGHIQEAGAAGGKGKNRGPKSMFDISGGDRFPINGAVPLHEETDRITAASQELVGAKVVYKKRLGVASG